MLWELIKGVFLMSTHNICFHEEISKISWYPLLSGAAIVYNSIYIYITTYV